MDKEINLETLSILELKALRSDVIDEYERIRTNLELVNQELRKRLSQGVNTPPKTPEVKKEIIENK